MPVIPSIQQLQATTPNILNAIRNDLGGTYADLIPMCADTTESIKAIGNVMMEYTSLQNSFINALVNRIGMTIITSKSYKNPWSMFKKGILEFGETIEEIFVQIAEPFQFDPADAEQTLFKRVMPNVESAFHRLNYAKVYEQTITKEQLKQAFLNMAGITDLISRITESMYSGMQYDEFLVMKYMLGKIALQGKVYPINIPDTIKANLEDIVTTIKEKTNTLTYMHKEYNMAGVQTFSEISDLYIIINNHFESQIDVSVLANAFNMEKVTFLGHRVGVDSFGDIDADRLAIIFKDDPSYVAFTTDELTALKNIPAMVVDKDFFMIFDNLLEMNSIPNPKGLYWNEFLHTWKTYSVSPFSNAILFTTLTPAITSVSLSPSTASGSKGVRIKLTATVVATGFADNSIVYSVNSQKSTITPDGLLTIASNETLTTLTVTATSKFDNTKKATATITVD